MSDLLEGVTWFRQSSVRIRRNGVELHVDPLGVDEETEADVVLLTHPHYDNFSEEDVDRVRGAKTVVLAPASMKKLIEGADHYLRPGDLLHLEPVEVLAVPAYNLDARFHPRESQWLGYVFTLGGITYYHAGDTDFLDSMKEIRCDVAFLPCGGRYTMGPAEAARAAEACGARLVVPIHWGDTEGSRGEAERLAELFAGEVRILERSADGGDDATTAGPDRLH